ncbi:MAG: hypothetical protein CVU39_23600 [Chloroflexi bacterium HGW-Chloroflexi-10]|nr:MAG: hypothetical protein CVU39_23600 [Chloroflexi bacterium HGW-Chloroflexi-10]
MENNQSKTQMLKTTAIVCAYNEEKTIQDVMDSLLQSTALDEIIAVDDGSKDRTAALLRKYQHIERVQVILLPENSGKGYAMTSAAMQANGEVLVFVDTDLKNLTPEHITLLLEPIHRSEIRMVVGVPVRGEVISRTERLDPCRSLSGQRVVYREDFLVLQNAIRYSGYGVETILNLHYKEQGKPVKFIYLPYLYHPIKVEKAGFGTALGEYWHEGKQIMQTAIRNPKLIWGALFSVLDR